MQSFTRIIPALALSLALAPVVQAQTISVPKPVDSVPADPVPVDPIPVDPGLGDPAPAEPTPAEPTPVDPVAEEPAPVDPAPVEPEPAEPTPPAEPVPAEPTPVEPAPAEPAPAEPAPAEPVPAEPVPAEPAPVEPAPAEPVPAEPTPAEPIPAEPVPAEPTPAEPAEPAPAEPAPSEPAPVPPVPVDHDHSAHTHERPDHAAHHHAEPAPAPEAPEPGHCHGDKHAAAPELEIAWQAEGLEVPESVLEVRHGKEHYFLVSLIDGDPFAKDEQGGIAKLSATGEIIDHDWVTGLSSPKGMALHHHQLYVTDIDEVVVIDLKSGEVTDRIPVEGASFLNDVAVGKRGTVYVSDTGNGQVIRLTDGVPEVYLNDVPSANGLFAGHHDSLLVGVGNSLVRYDSAREATVIAEELPYGIDGVAPVGHGGYVVSMWDGQIHWLDRKGEPTLLLDTVEEGINTADFAYSESEKLLVVPNFFSNTVTAYKLSWK